jgi:hypothetical protein
MLRTRHDRRLRAPVARDALAISGSIALVTGASCAHPTPARVDAPPGPSASAWTYEVVASAAGERLTVEATFPPGSDTRLGVGDDAAAPYLEAVSATHDGRPIPVARDGARLRIPGCAEGCRVRYVLRLGDAARASRDRDVAEPKAGGVQSPPSTWLLRPIDAPMGTPLRFHVTSAPGEGFAAGLSAVPGVADTYEARTDGTTDLPYAAFGRLRRVSLADGRVEAAFFEGSFRDERAVNAWIDGAARAVHAYYGGAPMARTLVLVEPTGGRRVGEATTMGGSGAAIEIAVGQDADAEALRRDWVLVHELIHTAMPNVERSHHWLEEGLATYVEPIVRARAGLVPLAEVWHDWVSDMPKGLPEAGDRGLDRTHTWGRTYWGGAVFCLQADVAIRQRTGNRRSLRDALQAIVASGGNVGVHWPVERVLDVGDTATGVPVLRETYERMATRPEAVDLAKLWRELGVRLQGDSVVFDDGAPLAAVRRAMVTTGS